MYHLTRGTLELSTIVLKYYVDGPRRTNLDMRNQYPFNVKDPTNDSDDVNKKYCDEKLSETGSSMSGDIIMGNNNITGLPDPPLLDSDAVSKS